MNPAISIIVPIYNAAMHIKKCVDSLCNQTFKDVEFIFVDDYSSDNSVLVLEEILASYQIPIAHFKIIRHPNNLGSATARNTGLAHASGKYIGWCDADDWIEPLMFEKMFKVAEREKSEIVWCDYYNSYETHEDYISQANQLNNISCVKALITGRLLGSMWNKLVLRSLYEKHAIRFPDGYNMCEDLRVTVQLFYYAEKIAYLNEGFYHYIKFNDSSISARQTQIPTVNADWIANVKGIVQFLQEKDIPNIELELGLLKLFPKKNLLVKGNNLESFKEWRVIFPEANRYVWKSYLPLHYKIVAFAADKKIWSVINSWLFVKRKLKNNNR